MKCGNCGADLPDNRLFAYCEECDKQYVKEARRRRKAFLDERRAARRIMREEMARQKITVKEWKEGIKRNT